MPASALLAAWLLLGCTAGADAGGSLGAGATRILFGSCSMPQLPQPLWPYVLARRPEVWIWGGDAVYGDRVDHFAWLPPHAVFVGGDGERLRGLYAMQGAVPGYQQLLNSSAVIVGTWDDHDYGINDGGKENPNRYDSQAAFLDFIGEPAGTARRLQEGVYDAKRFDFVTGGSHGAVLVVLLDLRFNRDPYSAGEEGDFLGEAQWQWLERTLAASTADVHVIMSSLQFLEPREVGENWGRLPAARRRLLKLLAQHRVRAPVILSGDVHFAELAVGVDNGVRHGRRLVEVTSSGMTHSWGTRDPSVDNWFLRATSPRMMWLAQSVMPWRYQMKDADTGRPLYDMGLNFGELLFDWEQQTLSVGIIGAEGEDLLRQDFPLQELGVDGGQVGPEDFGPIGGAPSKLRRLLGCAMLGGIPLMGMLLMLCCLVRTSLVVSRSATALAPQKEALCARSESSEEEEEDDDDDELIGGG